MKKKLSRIICIAAAAALVLALFAGCGNDGSKTAFTVNGEKVPFGEANFVLRTNQAEVYYQLVASYYSSGLVWDEEFTPEGEEEAIPYGEYFKEQAKLDIIKNYLLHQKSEEYGVSLDQTDIDRTTELADQFMEANKDVVDRLCVSRDNVLNMLQMYALKPKMKEVLTADIDRNVTDEEADMTTVTYIRLRYPESEETADDAAAEAAEDTDADAEEEPAKTKEEIYADCEEVLARLKEAGDLDEEAANALADEVNEDFFAMVHSYSPSEPALGEPVIEAIDTLKEDGEVYDGIIDNDGFYYLIKLNKRHDPEKIEEKKVQIIKERENDEFNRILDGWVDEAEIVDEEIWTETKVTDAETYLSTQFYDNEQAMNF